MPALLAMITDAGHAAGIGDGVGQGTEVGAVSEPESDTALALSLGLLAIGYLGRVWRAQAQRRFSASCHCAEARLQCQRSHLAVKALSKCKFWAPTFRDSVTRFTIVRKAKRRPRLPHAERS
jgi:hypothetical protein